MTALFNDLYAIVAVLSLYVAMRYLPVLVRRIRAKEYDRVWVSAALVAHNFGFAINDGWFYWARLHTIPSSYGIAWPVLAAKMFLLMGAIFWLVGVDGVRGHWRYVWIPIAIAVGFAWVLP